MMYVGSATLAARVNPPVLLTEATSTRAVALESVTFHREPFAPTSRAPWDREQRTRIILFAMNLSLPAGVPATAVTAIAEDATRRRYDLTVEYVGKVPGQVWMSAVILKLSDDLGDVGDVLVRITYQGQSSNRVRVGIGHIGGGPPDDLSPFVLEFDGSPQTVDYGYFWNEGDNLGRFFWEFWAMPGFNAGATYLLSDGYGGAHALLFGFAYFGFEESRYSLYGNIYDGANTTTFSSDEGPAPNEWGHFAVGWDGAYIVTYLNGVPVGRTAFAGPRRTPGFPGGGGRLLIGGSDHNNLDGRIAQVRGYEGSNPREDPAVPGSRLPLASFVPQTIFASGGNLLSNFFRPSLHIADLSLGHNGSQHVGRLRGTLFPYGLLSECPDCPLPQFVIDPTAPGFSNGTASTQASASVDAPLPVPSGAQVFDSFSRTNSTYALGGSGGLGSTEGGTAGVRAWQMSQPSSTLKPFGILNGRAVLLANGTCSAWVQTSSTTGNLDVRVDRRAGTTWGSGIHTGLSFRVIDSSNFFFAYTSDASDNPSGPKVLNVGYYSAGARTDLTRNVPMPTEWTTLRVVTRTTGSIDVYIDGSLIYSTGNVLMATATGAGIYNHQAGSGLVNRWDNFTIFDAPQLRLF
ncbi:MAG: LamG domain-containing protein [Acidobacteriota bacterium]|nr:LamG domain-containing protein [Acidobacteriota bacterium]